MEHPSPRQRAHRLQDLEQTSVSAHAMQDHGQLAALCDLELTHEELGLPVESSRTALCPHAIEPALTHCDHAAGSKCSFQPIEHGIEISTGDLVCPERMNPNGAVSVAVPHHASLSIPRAGTDTGNQHFRDAELLRPTQENLPLSRKLVEVEVTMSVEEHENTLPRLLIGHGADNESW